MLAFLRRNIVLVRSSLTRNWRVITLHFAPFFHCALASTIVALDQHSITYTIHPLPLQRFYNWRYIIYNSVLFVGTLFSKYLRGKICTSNVIFVNCTILVALFSCFPAVHQTSVFDVALAATGFAIGLLDCFINLSFLDAIQSNDKPLIHMLYMLYSAGGMIAHFLYRENDGKLIQHADSAKALTYGRYTDDEHDKAVFPFMIPILGIDATFLIVALAQIPLMYYCYWYSREEIAHSHKDSVLSGHRHNTEYEEISAATIKTAGVTKSRALRVTALSAVMCFVINGLQSIFPYYLPHIWTTGRYNNLSPRRIFVVNLLNKSFKGTVVFGRFVSFLVLFSSTPYLMIGISLLGYSVACCCIVFDTLFIFGVALTGFFLSSIYPNLILHTYGFFGVETNDLYVLVSASALGTLLYPLFLSQLLEKLGTRFFAAVNFFAIMLLVLLFVSIVNIQSQVEPVQGRRKGFMSFVWPFLSGGTQRTRKTLRTRMQRLSRRITRFRPASFNRKSLNRLRPGSFSRASLYRFRQNRRKRPDMDQPLCMQPTSSNFRRGIYNLQLPSSTTVSQISEHDSNVRDSEALCE